MRCEDFKRFPSIPKAVSCPFECFSKWVFDESPYIHQVYSSLCFVAVCHMWWHALNSVCLYFVIRLCVFIGLFFFSIKCCVYAHKNSICSINDNDFESEEKWIALVLWTGFRSAQSYGWHSIGLCHHCVLLMSISQNFHYLTILS